MTKKPEDKQQAGNDVSDAIRSVLKPIQRIALDQKSASVLLLICAVAALIIANSPFAQRYEEIVETPIGLLLGDQQLSMSLRHWINDGFMALFFFVIGLEIKRELLVGELRKPSQSIPVIAAALGGMLVPALFFAALNMGEDTLRGWAIPMATDTAFAIGVLALLGKRAPFGLTAFLLALAIIDDMGAVLVIALFYTGSLNPFYLSMAAVTLAMLFIANRLGVRHPAFFFLGGGLVWFATLNSGVHATLAGVLVALTVPARPTHSPKYFARKSRNLISKFIKRVRSSNEENPVLAEQQQHRLVEELQQTAKEATTPLQLWERTLEHPVALLVLPVFALVNAGIPLSSFSVAGFLQSPLALGIVLGLVLGKLIGISAGTWLVIKLGWGRLPQGMELHHTFGLGLLAGMGFTMSIFIAGLGFEQQPESLIVAKAGIILASLLAGLGGYLWLRFTGSDPASESS